MNIDYYRRKYLQILFLFKVNTLYILGTKYFSASVSLSLSLSVSLYLIFLLLCNWPQPYLYLLISSPHRLHLQVYAIYYLNNAKTDLTASTTQLVQLCRYHVSNTILNGKKMYIRPNVANTVHSNTRTVPSSIQRVGQVSCEITLGESSQTQDIGEAKSLSSYGRNHLYRSGQAEGSSLPKCQAGNDELATANDAGSSLETEVR